VRTAPGLPTSKQARALPLRSAQKRLGRYSSYQKRRAVFVEIPTQLRAIEFCISKIGANIVFLDHTVAFAWKFSTDTQNDPQFKGSRGLV
jgi:hypothetical protein